MKFEFSIVSRNGIPNFDNAVEYALCMMEQKDREGRRPLRVSVTLTSTEASWAYDDTELEYTFYYTAEER